MTKLLAFPEDFVWGTATAAFQIEGGVSERGQCIWDEFCRWPGKVWHGDNGDVADDHYHLYEQDVALMASLGLKAYRFSVSWPRVLPEGLGKVNAQGLDYYDRLVDVLLASGITPFVTLYHWDLPSALQRVGGWAARDTAYRFADYARVVVDRLGDRVGRWITHNEPWVAAFLGHATGSHAPGWQDLGLALQVAHHLLLSHGLAAPVLRERGRPGTQVGITLNLSPVYPASDRPEDVAAARRMDGPTNRWFLDPVFKGCYPEDMWAFYGYAVPRIGPEDMSIIHRPLDFLGVNYYARTLVEQGEGEWLDARRLRPEGEYTQMDWEVYPLGLTDLLLRLTQDYAPPAMYITENGCAYEDIVSLDGQVHDEARTAYLKGHLMAAHRAIQQGAPLIGYFAWSLLDNFEWSFGYGRRFGIVYVDYDTQRRIPKDSAKYYSGVVAANAVDP